ncbi:MAG: exonuclease domain-containing protein [Corynebacterium sp.]|nr:exonuclease domain-containing protein [Corynebacterium sp.]
MSQYHTYGYTLTIDTRGISAQPDILHASLGATSLQLRPEEIGDVIQISPASTYNPGALEINYTHGEQHKTLQLRFAPQTQADLELVTQAIAACKSGQAPAPQIPELNFVAFDVETANPRWGSICQIGAVKIRNGVIVDSRSWLCKPPPALGDFNPHNVRIHHINATDVADAMQAAQALSEFLEFSEGLPLVAHNASFDIGALQDCARETGIQLPTITFGCTLTLARRTLQLENNKLPTVAAHFGADLESHHDALADATACAKIMIGFAEGSVAETRSLTAVNEAAGIREGWLAGEVNQPVLIAGQAQATWGSPKASANADSPKKRGGGQWRRIATPEKIPEPYADADPSNALYQQHVTISGEFTPFDKEEIWEALAAHGAIIGKNVTKKTTLLACGQWQGKTSKQKRAEELQAKGQDIQIWDATQLFDALDLDSSTS